MLKEVQMSFRVESELRAAFTDAALQEHRPVAQVLRELMRAYVLETRERSQAERGISLSARERRRRENAVRFARASVGLEGFEPSEESERQAKRLMLGDIELDEFSPVTMGTEASRRR